MKSNEVWKPIPGFDKYEVSNLGRVRQVRKNNILKQSPAWAGYLRVTLYAGKKGKPTVVHKCVLRAFIGERPAGFQCAHANGNKTDNRIENLSWVTAGENASHRAIHGTKTERENFWNTKLTEDAVAEIRRVHVKGRGGFKGSGNTRHLAERFGVNKTTILKIVRGKTWTSVTEEVLARFSAKEKEGGG